jgi:YgiT-type zinc finger domain-containing protein
MKLIFRNEENTMKCPICRHGKTERGYATVVLERNKTTVIFKHVPADICNNCGEEFINENVSVELFSAARQAVAVGVQVDVREYLAA